MTITDTSTGCGAGVNATANQASTTVTNPTQHALRRLHVLLIAVDNAASVDGDEGAVTSVTDNDTASDNQTWLKAAEYTYAEGGAQNGATISVWYKVSSLFNNGSVITVNFSNSASRDRSAITSRSFNISGQYEGVRIEGTPATLPGNSADPDSLDVTTTSGVECLRVRAIAAESNDATELTATSSFTLFPGQTTSGGGSAANMAVRGEFVISTFANFISNPTLYSADNASVYVAFREVPPTIPEIIVPVMQPPAGGPR